MKRKASGGSRKVEGEQIKEGNIYNGLSGWKKCIFINAAIKSLDPPCLGKPSRNINHPFTCDNCYKLRHYLINLQKKKVSSKTESGGRRKSWKKRFSLRLRNTDRGNGKTESSYLAEK